MRTFIALSMLCFSLGCAVDKPAPAELPVPDIVEILPRAPVDVFVCECTVPCDGTSDRQVVCASPGQATHTAALYCTIAHTCDQPCECTCQGPVSCE
jgi:hypothetical protein